MSKQVTKQEASKALSAPMAPPPGAPHIGKQDFIASKILPMQYMSEKVKEQNAKAGELRDTIENKLFGGEDKPMEFIPIAASHFWVEYEIQAKSEVYLGQYDVTPVNEGQPREETKAGKKIKRVKTIECFVLLPEEVKRGDCFPYVLSFRMTSLKAGQILLSQMYVKNLRAGKHPYGNVCELSLTESSNDKGDYYVQHVKPLRTASTEELTEAQYWANLIGAGSVAKDDSDIKNGESEAAMKDVSSDQF